MSKINLKYDAVMRGKKSLTIPLLKYEEKNIAGAI